MQTSRFALVTPSFYRAAPLRCCLFRPTIVMESIAKSDRRVFSKFNHPQKLPQRSLMTEVPQTKKRKVVDTRSDAPRNNLLLVKRLSEKAKLPTRGSPLAAGYDLCSAERKLVPAHGKALIDTQISIALLPGTYGRIAPRSGLASKFMIDTGAGVIDADYRGIVRILLFNHSDEDFQVEEGDRVAQLIIERIFTPDVLEVQDLDETIRGANGWGSTGGHSQLAGQV